MADGRAVLRIDLAAARANWRLFAGLAPEAGATVKADAYGLGADRLAPAFEAEGCRTFFVAQVQEGAALRALLHADCAIYVYNGPAGGDHYLYSDHALRPVLNSPEQIAAWRDGGGGACALHIDTGMNRLGLSADEARDLAATGHGLDLRLVMSHLACADDPDNAMTARQLADFKALSALFPGVPRSLSNSAGALTGPDYQFDLTRPGVGLYGGQPRSTPCPDLKPVVRIAAPVIRLRTLKQGEAIGYGAAFTAPQDMKVAIVALGYADGFLRASWPGGYGLLDGARAPLVGRVSMDLAAVDVTGLDAAPGAMVEFLGPALEDTARAAGTISYEFLTRLGARFERVYAE